MRLAVRMPAIIGLMALISGCGAPETPSETMRDDSASTPASVAEVMPGITAAATAGTSMPRGDLMDFVETYPNGVYGFSNKSTNAGQTRGLLSYGATGSAEAVVAFYKASMERQGLAVGPEERSRDEDRSSIRIEGTDGRRSLSAVVVDRGAPDVVVTLNFSGPG